MKKLFLLILILATSMDLSSKSMTELWQSIPDSIIPYIERSQRQEMTDFIAMGANAKVRHALQGESKMDTITSDYIHLTLNESMQMELKRLPHEGGDSILCLVKTWGGPCQESEVYFYSQDWQLLAITNPLARYRENPLLSRPDTMSAEKFEELSHKVGFVLAAASLSPTDNSLSVYQSVPLLSAEDNQKIKTMLTPVSLKWNGQGFKLTNT